MSDVDKSSKTEPPTEKKLSEARSRGQFAKAPEIGMTATLLAGLLVLFFWAPAKAGELMLFTKSIFQNLSSIQATQEGMSTMFSESYLAMGLIVLPMLVGCFFASLLAEGLQTGFSLTPKALEPKFSKLSPVSGIKRVWGLKALKTFAVDFLKFLSIGTVVWLTVLIFLKDPIFYAPIPIQHIPGFIYELVLVMFALLVLMLLVVAIINFIIKKNEHKIY